MAKGISRCEMVIFGTVGAYLREYRGSDELEMQSGSNRGANLQIWRVGSLSRIIFQIPRASLEKSRPWVDFWKVEGLFCKVVKVSGFWDLF
jgi:hypothetical protein